MRWMTVLAVAGLVLSGCNAPVGNNMQSAATPAAGDQLPGNDADAARNCWPVASAKTAQGKVFRIADMAEIIAYATVVAKAEPGPGPITDKIGAVMNVRPSDADKKKLRANLDNFQGQCRARFPVAAGSAAPSLPSDPVDRGLWCLMAAAFLDKAMEGAGRKDYPEKGQVAGVLRAATGAVSRDALVAKGITSEAQFAAYRDQQVDALMDNRLDKVIAACPGAAQ